MSDTSEIPDLGAAYESLRADREAMSWTERRELAALLTDAIDDDTAADTAISLVYLFAEDPKPEVRKEVADLLIRVPDDDFMKLAAGLSDDTSSFVRKAVERAMDRRRRGLRDSQRKRRTIDEVEAQLDSIGKYHGKLAADRARKVADRQFDILVGAIVHDIRGILSPLKTNVSTLKAHIDSGHPDQTECRENLDRMTERLAFLERFVEDMRTYSQATPVERHRERVADMVKEATGIVVDELRGRGYDLDAVPLSVDVPGNLTAEVARYQIVATVAHVLKNAFEAFEMQGAMQDERSIEVTAAQRDAGNVEIVVRNSGPGIPPEDLADIQMFLPGKTTKKNRGGTGFGLPTAYRYAQGHGGSLAIENGEGVGTVVTITLPVEQEEDKA